MFFIKSKLLIPSLEKKYAASKDLTRVFPLFGYEASQINMNMKQLVT
jgi:hypothetical protein